MRQWKTDPGRNSRSGPKSEKNRTSPKGADTNGNLPR